MKDLSPIGIEYHTYCRNCSAFMKCPKYKKTIKPIAGKLLKQEKKERKKIGGEKTAVSRGSMPLAKWSNKRLPILIRKELTSDITKCFYESEIADSVKYQFIKKYNFEDYPELSLFVDQIIKLKIKDFRLNLAHNEYGIFQSTNKGLRMIPGYHYSIDIALKITDIIEKMNKIVYGEKSQNLNVNVNLTDALVKRYEKSLAEENKENKENKRKIIKKK